MLYPRPDVRMVPQPACTDALLAPDDGWLFVLERGPDGRVRGMSATRSRDLRFARVP